MYAWLAVVVPVLLVVWVLYEGRRGVFYAWHSVGQRAGTFLPPVLSGWLRQLVGFLFALAVSAVAVALFEGYMAFLRAGIPS